MRVYLPDISFDSPLNCNKVLNCIISEKVDDGYIINILGQKVFAKSDLNFKPNDIVKVKVIENLPKQLTLKVIPDIKTSLNTSNFTDSDKQLPMLILSKLNLSMTDDRLKLVSEILSSLYKHESNLTYKPFDFSETENNLGLIKQFLKMTSFNKNIPPKFLKREILENINRLQKYILENTKNDSSLQSVKTILRIIKDFKENITSSTDTDIALIIPAIRKLFSRNSKDRIKKELATEKSVEKMLKDIISTEKFVDKSQHVSEKSLLKEIINHYIRLEAMTKPHEKIEKLIESILAKLKDNIENETLTFKKAIAVKILNTAYDDKIKFYFLPFLPNTSIYIKISKKRSDDNKKAKIERPDGLNLSILLETYNLGKVLIDLIDKKNRIFYHLTFEDQESLEYVKNASLSSADPFIRSIRFSLKKISMEDFFFQDLKTANIPNGVNVKI